MKNKKNRYCRIIYKNGLKIMQKCDTILTQDTGHRTQDTGHRTQDTGHRTQGVAGLI